MPPDQHHHNHDHHTPKPNPKLLSLILKALIMSFITSLFFLFLGVAAILLLFLAGGALHRRRRHHRPIRPNSSHGFSPRDLRKLSQFRFGKRIEGGLSQSDCVVCLDGFRDGQWCRKLLGCDHIFHRRCLDTWLIKVPVCPICRNRVRLDPPEMDSSESVEEDVKLWWGFNGNTDLRFGRQ
ncbi:hypothetical protein UlMin_004161 [Ulmus minor]